MSTPQLGDAVYFGPSDDNGHYGHTGIVTGDDKFTSVTFNGIQTYLVSWWDQYSAPLLGYVRY